MSDRLQRISENAGRIFSALLTNGDPVKLSTAGEQVINIVVEDAIKIEQEVTKQTLAAFGPKTTCTCEDVPGDHARCPIHGE